MSLDSSFDSTMNKFKNAFIQWDTCLWNSAKSVGISLHMVERSLLRLQVEENMTRSIENKKIEISVNSDSVVEIIIK